MPSVIQYIRCMFFCFFLHTQIPCWDHDMFDSKENQQERQTVAHTLYRCVRNSGWHSDWWRRTMFVWQPIEGSSSSGTDGDWSCQQWRMERRVNTDWDKQKFAVIASQGSGFLYLYPTVNLMCGQETRQSQFKITFPIQHHEISCNRKRSRTYRNVEKNKNKCNPLTCLKLSLSLKS